MMKIPSLPQVPPLATPDDLKVLRKSLKLKQAKFAEGIGMTCRGYQNLEGGQSPIKDTHRYAILWAIYHGALK